MTSQSITAMPATVASAEKPKRYHPLLVALHWLIAIMILGTVLLIQTGEGEGERFRSGQGDFPRQGLQQGNPPPQTFDSDEAPQGFPQGGFPQAQNSSIFSVTGIHILIGATLLILLVVRLVLRLTTKHPEKASTGNKFFDWIGTLTHWGLYLFLLGMTVTGIANANQRGLLARMFGIGSTPTPGSFRRGFSLGFFHEGVWTLFLLLILLHIGAALYHQFILKDNLFARMWFGKANE